MQDRTYKTITGESNGYFKEKGSKFISYAYPLINISDAKNKVELLRKQYHDARHYCFAYIIRENDRIITRANDDGEPGHSAGDPILGQIKSFELENVLVVVVRYFGGTKLGVSGLIHAYKTAAADAIKHARVVSIIVKRDVQISYPYDKTNEVMRLISEFEVDIIDQVFEESCLIKGKVLQSKYSFLMKKMNLILKGTSN